MAIDVSDAASLNTDQMISPLFYSRIEIPWFWLINLRDRRVEIHSEPSGRTLGAMEGYRRIDVYSPDQSIPLVLDGRKVALVRVASLLP